MGSAGDASRTDAGVTWNPKKKKKNQRPRADYPIHLDRRIRDVHFVTRSTAVPSPENLRHPEAGSDRSMRARARIRC